MNSVKTLQNQPFSKRSLEGKLEIKPLGPDRPDLLTKSSSRRFTRSWYSRYEWLTGCGESGKVDCLASLSEKSKISGEQNFKTGEQNLSLSDKNDL